MKGAGITFMILGVIVLVVAFAMKTSVTSYSSFGNSGDVINIGLLQNQLMVWQLGLTSFATGGVLFSAGTILASLREGGVVPESTLFDTGEYNGKICDWCGSTFKYPLSPCSSLTKPVLENPATKITLERCREELTARGIKYHGAN